MACCEFDDDLTAAGIGGNRADASMIDRDRKLPPRFEMLEFPRDPHIDLRVAMPSILNGRIVSNRRNKRTINKGTRYSRTFEAFPCYGSMIDYLTALDLG